MEPLMYASACFFFIFKDKADCIKFINTITVFYSLTGINLSKSFQNSNA